MTDPAVPDSQIDNELAYMREQIEKLERHRSALSSTLLSSRSTLTRIQRAKARPDPASASAAAALSTVQKHQKQALENLHRTCAGITAFRVQDPDPYAVDNGKILGVRIDVSVKGESVPPYYLLLNRPSPGSPALRIHKHTIPPCIPLASLEAKYLPQPKAPDAEDAPVKPAPEQNLHRLARVLRGELAGHHMRISAVSKLQEDAGLSKDDVKGKAKIGKAGIAGIAALDIDGREIQIKWADDSIGRIWLSKAGVVEKAVVRAGESGARRRDLERRLLSGGGRVEGLVERLSG